MERNFEQRQSREHLEKGKEYLIELIEQQDAVLAKYDQEKHKQLLRLVEDLKKVDDALEIKKIADVAKKFGIPQYNLRAEDRESMRATLDELEKLSIQE